MRIKGKTQMMHQLFQPAIDFFHERNIFFGWFIFLFVTLFIFFSFIFPVLISKDGRSFKVKWNEAKAYDTRYEQINYAFILIAVLFILSIVFQISMILNRTI